MIIKEVKLKASELFLKYLKSGIIDYPNSNIDKPIWEYLEVNSLLNEKWYNIKGYEESYQISNLSRIKSLSKKENRYKDKILKQAFYKDGYMYVTLSQVKYKVHRLMGLVFISNPLNKEQVNHKNGIKWDNRCVNLEWNTPLENQLHAIKTGLKVSLKGIYAHDAISVLQYSLDGKFLKEWGCIKDAGKELGIDSGTISKCCKKNKNYKQSYGFIWRYKSEMVVNGNIFDLPVCEIPKFLKPKFAKRMQTTLNNKIQK